MNLDVEVTLLKSLNANLSVELTFSNHSPRKVEINWIDYKGKELLYGEINPGQNFQQNTFATHFWNARSSNNKRCLMIYEANNNKTQRVIIIDFH